MSRHHLEDGGGGSDIEGGGRSWVNSLAGFFLKLDFYKEVHIWTQEKVQEPD